MPVERGNPESNVSTLLFYLRGVAVPNCRYGRLDAYSDHFVKGFGP